MMHCTVMHCPWTGEPINFVCNCRNFLLLDIVRLMCRHSRLEKEVSNCKAIAVAFFEMPHETVYSSPN